MPCCLFRGGCSSPVSRGCQPSHPPSGPLACSVRQTPPETARSRQGWTGRSAPQSAAATDRWVRFAFRSWHDLSCQTPFPRRAAGTSHHPPATNTTVEAQRTSTVVAAVRGQVMAVDEEDEHIVQRVILAAEL